MTARTTAAAAALAAQMLPLAGPGPTWSAEEDDILQNVGAEKWSVVAASAPRQRPGLPRSWVKKCLDSTLERKWTS
ncbi:hypothetical protein JKP88DRAFT_352746 [Tribonema minus]|uniref:Myb-like domain-containing protein n=1 Tax=Tribonema minus TaxID=303371 RepID=A0A836CLY7_9STRA|nr:hypothetical protein JKP88DRAFT_352746 [Tribonema minus]